MLYEIIQIKNYNQLLIDVCGLGYLIYRYLFLTIYVEGTSFTIFKQTYIKLHKIIDFQ